ncbi:hypothetical protein C8Q77DRAFT_1214236 [Trametes polyzona]|nr:hypothetical protein C8Q77DRAFT_1214236 [Trametes polyzona]
MAVPGVHAKPLPPPAKDEKLPPAPSLDFDDRSLPAPPPKIVHDPAPDAPPPHKPLPPIDVKAATLGTSDLSLGSAPLTPLTPAPGSLPSIPPSPSSEGKPKKANPLTDLIDTEKVYVELLTGIIRKVAAAWSRSNLPPPELDTMFRSIESIYKANRALLAKLKEIGTNPSSPKALGDLLMRWIDDLDGPYTNYVTKYCNGFDTWDPVQSNPRVRTILAMFSSSNPPPLPATAPAHPSEPPIWTLDELFLLPKGRIKYYKKLYGRLLKSTTPGRSDHRLLSGALDKLDRLLATLDSRASIQVGGGAPPPAEAPLQPIETEDEVVIDMRTRQSTLGPQPREPSSISASPSQRASDSTRASGSLSSSGRRSEDTAPTTDSRGSTSTLNMPVTDLERRLSTERTLDLFSMKPKQVRLQIAPPNLHYTRELRCSTPVVISFTPKSTGVEVVQERGHIFLLTDLMLVCERMSPKEVEMAGRDGPDMWLLYPPLTGKHLRVAPVDDYSLSVTILRKETLILKTDSTSARDRLITDFRECIDTASSLFPSSSKNPPPPVPALPSTGSNMGNMASRPPIDRSQASSTSAVSEATSERSSASMSPTRALSPASVSSSSRRSNDAMSGPPSRANSTTMALVDAALSNSMSRMDIGGGGPSPGQQGYPQRSTSVGSSGGPPPSFGPGQVMPPQNFGPGQTMPPRGPLGPGQVMPPQSFQPGQVMPPQGYGPGPGMPPQGYGPGPGMPPNGHPGGMGRPPPSAYGQGMPPQRSGSLTQGPPQIGQSYQGVPQQQRSVPPQGLPPAPRPMPPGAYPPPRPPSEPAMDGGLRKSPSSRSLASQYDRHQQFTSPPPMPDNAGDLLPPRPGFLPRSDSTSSLPSMPSSGLHAPQPRPLLPSAQISMRSVSTAGSFSIEDPSPPGSPVEERQPTGPVTSVISAQMKCKVFLKREHAQWKSLGSARLRLYREDPTNIKQLVVEADNKDKTVLISTIVLTDGVERVGKTGVAIELSDKGLRTGIVYMIQLRNEKSASGLFDELLAGSDRATR